MKINGTHVTEGDDHGYDITLRFSLPSYAVAQGMSDEHSSRALEAMASAIATAYGMYVSAGGKP
jgi:hypothetical protein|tara:strand:- start:3627 stop:3818 length:192 start_codon:yes stop_codon:yes gene_type:complete